MSLVQGQKIRLLEQKISKIEWGMQSQNNQAFRLFLYTKSAYEMACKGDNKFKWECLLGDFEYHAWDEEYDDIDKRNEVYAYKK